MNRWIGLAALGLIATPAAAADLTGQSAYGDWKSDAPGVTRKITPADLPAIGASHIGVAQAGVVAKPANAELKVPAGFHVEAFAKLDAPRQIRVAPNGDIFVAESQAGKIRVLRAADGAAKPSQDETFAEGLKGPFGIAFYPQGANPQWVYVGEGDAVVRFPYRNGDLKARGAAETVVPTLPSGGNHVTRDVAFSPDGKTMLVSVGSGSNVAEEMPKKTPDEAKAWQADHALGAAWGPEEDRADVLAFDPEGHGKRVFAAGIRNCVTVTFQPGTDTPWCATNERDMLGDNLPPDYVTRVRQGAFYGWPWYYIGDHEDPRQKDQRPDLAGKVTVPDVLIQPHSAPLGLTFYEAKSGPAAFPAEYRGQAFAALHGSWNRANRTGYKVVRIVLKNGVPTGEYQDFLTGFVVDQGSVWGRPVGVAVAHDGALLVTDDASGMLWRVSYGAH